MPWTLAGIGIFGASSIGVAGREVNHSLLWNGDDDDSAGVAAILKKPKLRTVDFNEKTERGQIGSDSFGSNKRDGLHGRNGNGGQAKNICHRFGS